MRSARMARRGSLDFERPDFLKRVGRLPWGLVLLLTGVAVIGIAALYSATLTNPEESMLPARHAMRFVIALVLMIGMGLVPIGFWMKAAWPAYFATLLLLVVIHIPALILILVPAALIFKQPDFGTTLALFASGGILIFLGGLSLRVILGGAIIGAACVPLVYMFVLEDYQKERSIRSWRSLPGRPSTRSMTAIRSSRPRSPSGRAAGRGRASWRAHRPSSTIFQNSTQTLS